MLCLEKWTSLIKNTVIHRNYLNKRRGAHLIFYLSEGALI